MTKKTMSTEQKQLVLVVERLVSQGAPPGQIVAAASALAESLERSGVTDDLTSLGPLPSDIDGIAEWLERAIKIRGWDRESIDEFSADIRAMEEQLQLPVDEGLTFEQRIARIEATLGTKQ